MPGLSPVRGIPFLFRCPSNDPFGVVTTLYPEPHTQVAFAELHDPGRHPKILAKAFIARSNAAHASFHAFVLIWVCSWLNPGPTVRCAMTWAPQLGQSITMDSEPWPGDAAAYSSFCCLFLSARTFSAWPMASPIASASLLSIAPAPQYRRACFF